MMRLALLAVALAACSGHSSGSTDPTLGAACVNNGNCAHSCYTGGDFPGGFCSFPCRSDGECTQDALCVQTQGIDGVCMFACAAFNCSRLGPNWGCHDVQDVAGDTVQVCRGN
jgi:hypothetical protein